jgi:hypothetical protein
VGCAETKRVGNRFAVEVAASMIGKKVLAVGRISVRHGGANRALPDLLRAVRVFTMCDGASRVFCHYGHRMQALANSRGSIAQPMTHDQEGDGGKL